LSQRQRMGDTGLENLPGGVLRLPPPCLLRSGAPRCPQLRSRCDHECDHGRVPPRRLLFVRSDSAVRVGRGDRFAIEAGVTRDRHLTPTRLGRPQRLAVYPSLDDRHVLLRHRLPALLREAFGGSMRLVDVAARHDTYAHVHCENARPGLVSCTRPVQPARRPSTRATVNTTPLPTSRRLCRRRLRRPCAGGGSRGCA
jgi:hypothetical protein